MAELDLEQERWNEYGRKQVAQIKANPARFKIDPAVFPMPYRLDDGQVADLHEITGDLRGKKVLELGCGYGRFASYLSLHGAEVTAIDLGYELVNATRALAGVNDQDVRVAQVNIKDLPFASESFDVIIGLAVLHHLPEPEAASVIKDAHRLVRSPGVVVFYETVEDSKAFDFVQKLLPAGKPGDDQYRPSRLQRKAWKQFMADLDEREMTTAEFVRSGTPFQSVEVRGYGLIGRLERLVGTRHKARMARIDRILLSKATPLRKLARFALVVYRK